MIKAIIFDCFGVLTGDKWKEFVATLPKSQREPARELNRALDRGQLSLHDFSDAMHDLTGNAPERVEDVINAEMHKNTDLLDYIKDLGKKYKIGLISNVSSNWIRESFLSKSEVELFDDVLLSYEVGITKPDPRIYNMAAERLGVQANECVLIDDGVGNCEGAKAVGMQAIVYTDFVSLKQQLEKLLANTDH
jgi:epoxide hydrolase-like predicted phosphatase